LRVLFALSIKHECCFEFHWLSTHENVYADLLSRDREQAFLIQMFFDSVWSIGPCLRHAECGKVRCLGKAYSADVAGDHPRRTAPAFVMAVSFPRASVFDGLPAILQDDVTELMDERLQPSSMRTVNAAMMHWRSTCSLHGWQELILSDDPSRGGKLASFVMRMVQDTELVYDSISRYVWGVRTWMKSKGQVDPIFGVYDWQDFMMSVHVKTWCVGEPRRAVPLELLRLALAAVNLHVFWEVQMALFIVLYLFSFSRSEHPCPKTLDGFDGEQHAKVCDIQIVTWRTVRCVGLRLKVIKQDPRMERPEAAGNEDWVYIGNVDDQLFSVFHWLQKVFAFHAGARDPNSPFFVDDNMSRCLTYGNAMKHFRSLIARISNVETANKFGLHSSRVTGWNGARTGPNGEEVAVAHGGWHGGSHRRYDRFTRDDVLNLPNVILAAAPHVFNDVPAAGAALIPQIGSESTNLAIANVVPRLVTGNLLPGWSIVLKGNETRTYKSYLHITGITARSLPEMRDRDLELQGSKDTVVPLLLLTSKPTGYVMVDEAAEVPGPPFGQRCSNFSQGCMIVSVFGRHSGLCSYVLLVGKRRR